MFAMPPRRPVPEGRRRAGGGGPRGERPHLGSSGRFNTDQDAQFTSAAFTDVLNGASIAISTDSKGRWMDNGFVEKCKVRGVYLPACEGVAAARAELCGQRFMAQDSVRQGNHGGGEHFSSVARRGRKKRPRAKSDAADKNSVPISNRNTVQGERQHTKREIGNMKDKAKSVAAYIAGAGMAILVAKLAPPIEQVTQIATIMRDCTLTVGALWAIYLGTKRWKHTDQMDRLKRWGEAVETAENKEAGRARQIAALETIEEMGNADTQFRRRSIPVLIGMIEGREDRSVDEIGVYIENYGMPNSWFDLEGMIPGTLTKNIITYTAWKILERWEWGREFRREK